MLFQVSSSIHGKSKGPGAKKQYLSYWSPNTLAYDVTVK